MAELPLPNDYHVLPNPTVAISSSTDIMAVARRCNSLIVATRRKHAYVSYNVVSSGGENLI
jgi:hypothetical protein